VLFCIQSSKITINRLIHDECQLRNITLMSIPKSIAVSPASLLPKMPGRSRTCCCFFKSYYFVFVSSLISTLSLFDFVERRVAIRLLFSDTYLRNSIFSSYYSIVLMDLNLLVEGSLIYSFFWFCFLKVSFLRLFNYSARLMRYLSVLFYLLAIILVEFALRIPSLGYDYPGVN
jgi:hypothetical protein